MDHKLIYKIMTTILIVLIILILLGYTAPVGTSYVPATGILSTFLTIAVAVLLLRLAGLI